MMQRRKLPKYSAEGIATFVFLTEAGFHGFVRHDWLRAGTDVVSLFAFVLIYWFGRYVWAKGLDAFYGRKDGNGSRHP